MLDSNMLHINVIHYFNNYYTIISQRSWPFVPHFRTLRSCCYGVSHHASPLSLSVKLLCPPLQSHFIVAKRFLARGILHPVTHQHTHKVNWRVIFYIHGSVHRNSILIISNKMQEYAGIYLLQNHSTCFGCPSHPSSGVHKTVTAASGTVIVTT